MLEELTEEKQDFLNRLFYAIKVRGKINKTNLSAYQNIILNYKKQGWDISKYSRKIKYYKMKQLKKYNPDYILKDISKIPLNLKC